MSTKGRLSSTDALFAPPGEESPLPARAVVCANFATSRVLMIVICLAIFFLAVEKALKSAPRVFSVLVLDLGVGW